MIERSVFMQTTFQMHTFLKRFFEGQHCVIKQDTPSSLTVQLTKSVDKAIMNRPFYWHYKEWMNEAGVPKEITLQTNFSKENNLDWITVASPTFDSIFSYLQKHSVFIHLYENIQTNEKTLLQPWLLINMSIIYEGMQKWEDIISIGLNLVNGAYQINMMEAIKTIDFSTTISDFCFTTSPLIQVDSGYKRIEKLLDEHVSAQSHQWAVTAYAQMKDQLSMVDYFYKNNTDIKSKTKAKKEIKQLLQPTITYDVINGGIIYLDASYLQRNQQKEKTPTIE